MVNIPAIRFQKTMKNYEDELISHSPMSLLFWLHPDTEGVSVRPVWEKQLILPS